jgi:chromosome segregation ATPase
MAEIESAALYINNSLISKGYIRESERLLFKYADSSPEEQATNTSRIINTIYALLKTVESDAKIKDGANIKIQELQKGLERERTQYSRLESKYDALDNQFQAAQRAHESLESALRSEKSQAGRYKEAIVKNKNSVQQLKLKCSNELRRRDIEIARLKELLRDPRRSTRTGLTRTSGTLSTYDSYANVPESLQDSGQELIPVLSQQLIEYNAELTSENRILYSLLHKVNFTICDLTEGNSEYARTSGPDPSNAAGVAVRAANAQDLGELILESLSQIRKVLNSPNFVSLAELKEKERQVKSLQLQLKEATENWQKALKTMDEWKSYRASRDTIASTKLMSEPKRQLRKQSVASDGRRKDYSHEPKLSINGLNAIVNGHTSKPS